MATSRLRAAYPELAHLPLVTVDVVDDANTLGSIKDESQDFVIASHVIEHCENPIGALHNWLRVLRPGGIAFVVVPDKRRTFDHDRPLTSVQHLLNDHFRGSVASRTSHYREYVRLVERVPANKVDAKAREYEQTCYSIHFHVWTRESFLEFLDLCRGELKMPLSVEASHESAGGIEFIVILRKLEHADQGRISPP